VGGDLQILEIGAGIGSMTRKLSRYGFVTATDIDQNFLDTLNRKYISYSNITTKLWDATDPIWDGAPKFDLIVSLNVIEHIENDQACLTHWKSLLSAKGHLILLTPNFSSLFSAIDEAVGHYRRYNKADILKKLDQAGLKSHKVFYANAFAILGWLINSKLSKRANISRFQLFTYGLIKSAFSWIETQFERFIGLSIITLSQNTESDDGELSKELEQKLSG